MPTVDIKIHTKGFLSEPIIYKNVREYQIAYIEKVCDIRFYYTPNRGKRKGIESYYQFNIPIENLLEVSVRRKED